MVVKTERGGIRDGWIQSRTAGLEMTLTECTFSCEDYVSLCKLNA